MIKEIEEKYEKNFKPTETVACVLKNMEFEPPPITNADGSLWIAPSKAQSPNKSQTSKMAKKSD